MNHEAVKLEHERDYIHVAYHESAIEVDGSQATFARSDLEQFRYPRKIELRPFPEPYLVPAEKLTDRAFIRALTIKEQSAVLDPGPVLAIDGVPYHALQLRAIVNDVTLRDSFDQITKWGGDAAQRLTFVDTPGLAVNGSIKDEVLKHYLEKKSHQIVLQLWKQDELDIVVHLVLCGRQSDFASLWKDIERECGPTAMDDLQDRLVLAINGMNVYFTNRDLKKRFLDPEIARREGDHFATTIEDNILQKMSPRGRVRPARVCFLDARSIVELLTGSYPRAYQEYREAMQSWLRPGGVGYGTLAQLGLLESFQQNIDALCDADDRGQGFLVRQIIDLVRERGAPLLIRKFLIKTRLYATAQNTLDTLLKYYDAEGRLNRAGVQEAIKSCLCFLDQNDPRGLETFAQDEMDARIAALVPDEEQSPVEWASRAFTRMGEELKKRILARASVAGDVAHEFVRYFDGLLGDWTERWGYHACQLTPPGRGMASSADLVRHCLKIHCREILHQLTIEQGQAESGVRYQQGPQDQEQVKGALALLQSARRQAIAICADYGVDA
ncbi:MAG: hypothetical protein U1E76_03690 [Planctomycetota bacterium]